MKKGKNTRKRSGLTIVKITSAQIEAIEREYYQRLNGEMPKWQADMYA
jgi:hypothetical protein